MVSVCGVARLPWGLQAAMTLTAYSRPPFSAFVASMDFNGDGTRNDLLPGSRINQFGRSLTADDLRRLVDAYNATYGGRQTLGGQTAPAIALPDAFAFDDRFFTQDLRVSRTFTTRPPPPSPR